MSTFGKKTRNPGWRRGSHWVECQRTGMLIRSEDAVQEWTGAIVSRDEWEPRHPQDLLRGKQDRMAASGLVNPESIGHFVAGGGRIAVAGFAVAGEAVAGVDFTESIPTSSFSYPAGHDSIN